MNREILLFIIIVVAGIFASIGLTNTIVAIGDYFINRKIRKIDSEERKRKELLYELKYMIIKIVKDELEKSREITQNEVIDICNNVLEKIKEIKDENKI